MYTYRYIYMVTFCLKVVRSEFPKWSNQTTVIATPSAGDAGIERLLARGPRGHRILQTPLSGRSLKPTHM